MTDWHRLIENQRVIDAGERGFHYGDGLFETIAIRNGQPRLWEHHIDRLSAGCERIGLDAPGTAVLQRRLEESLRESDHNPAFCTAKIILTAGTSQRGYGRNIPTPATVYVGVYAGVSLNRPAYVKGVATMMCETRLAVGSAVAGLKTLNRIEQVLARSECLATGAFEGLTRDADDRLICGTMSNVFIAKDKILSTPSLERCGVAGTMRRHVIESLATEGIDVDVADLSEDNLIDADEVFITNSQFGAVPVHRCGDHKWSIGDTTRDVMALLAENGIDECRL
jgi:4-amino-4-deoxychorismate lyase